MKADAFDWTRDQALEGVEMMRACVRRHAFAPHAHAEYTFGLNLAGCGLFRCRGATHVAAPGSVNLIYPDEVHTGRPQGNAGWLYVSLYVTPEAMRRTLSRIGARALGRMDPVSRDPNLAQALRRLITRFTAPSSTGARAAELAAFVALLAQAEPAFAPGKHDDALERVRDYLHAHWAEAVPLELLAREAGRHPLHLVRTFHARYGAPPHAYQTMLRVRRGQSMLRAGETPAGVAAACGFYDQSHFNRAFKRVVGVAPGRYRKALRSAR